MWAGVRAVNKVVCIVIDKKGRFNTLIERQEDELGGATIGRSVTATLRVSPIGTGADGLSWRTAYTTIQDALDAASTDTNDCTLIKISPHATYYDIDTTGDPTWVANVILKGTHRNWGEIRNNHVGATSILKLTGKSGVEDLTFNLGSGSNNGLILTQDGFRVDNVIFEGEDLTGAATALWIDGNEACHGKIRDCAIDGHVTHMTGLLLDNACHNEIKDSHFHECLTAVQIIHADSGKNFFANLDIGECALGLDIDAGSEQHFVGITFHDNTVNVDDEVEDHIWDDIMGEFSITVEPDDLAGVTLTANVAANVWGVDTELRAAVTSTKPFRIVAVIVEPQIAQWYNLRLSDDSGSTFFDHVMVSTARAAGSTAPPGTGYIFNAGTRISGSIKAESGGSDTVQVWLKIQEI